jgi:hypothetical protein
MANTLKTQIDNLIGVQLASTIYDDWLVAGARTIVDLLKPEDLERHSVSVSVPITTGLSVSLYRIWKILVSGYDATQYPAGFETQIVDANSLLKSSVFTPGYIINAGTLKCYNGANCAGDLIGIAYPTAIDSSTATDITGVPENMHHAVILYSAIQGRIKQLSELMKTTLEALTISDIDTSSIIAPTSPTLGTVSYVDATGATVSATSIGTIPVVPTFTPATVPTDIATAISAFDTAMTAEDIELAQSQLVKADKMLGKYQSLIQEGLGSFNKDMEKFKADIQKVIDQAQITLQEAQANAKYSTDVSVQNKAKTMEAIVQNNNSLLQKYQGDTTVYAQKVNALVSQYGTNTQIFSQKVSRTMNEHQGLLGGLQQLQSEYHELINSYLGIVQNNNSRGN